MAWDVSRAPLRAALAVIAVFVGNGQASAGPAERQAQQVHPTGAEDAPRAAARTAAAAAEAEVSTAQMTSRSEEGLAPVLHADGTVSLDLEGRFMSVATAALGPDGRVSVSCGNHAGEHEHAEASPVRSRPTAPIDGRAASRAGTVRLPASAPVSKAPAQEER